LGGKAVSTSIFDDWFLGFQENLIDAEYINKYAKKHFEIGDIHKREGNQATSGTICILSIIYEERDASMSNLTIRDLTAMAEKYGLTELEEFLSARSVGIGGTEYTVGLIGDQFVLPQCLNSVFPEAGRIIGRTNRSFSISIVKGRGPVFHQTLPEGSRELTPDELRALLLEKPPLDSEDMVLPPVFGQLSLDTDALDGLRVIATASAQDLAEFSWPELLLEIDSCHLALSAQKLLSKSERELASGALKERSRTYILLSAEDLNVPDREEVERELTSFDPKGRVVPVSDPESAQALWTCWASEALETEAVRQRREDALAAYGGAKLAAYLTGQIEARRIGEKSAAAMVRDLSYVKERLPIGKNQTVRFFRTDCLEPAKLDIRSDLVRFNVKMREDLRTGIEEEKDVQQLQRALPGFVGRSWDEFLKETFKARWESKAASVDALLEQNICENLDGLLREYLPGNEYQEMIRLISASLHEPEIVCGGSGTAWPGPMTLLPAEAGEEHRNLQHLLPGVFIAVGGIAVLSNLLLPGIALALAGYDMHGKIDAERKEQLLNSGIELSNHCLVQSEKAVDEAFAQMEKSVDGTVEKCYNMAIEYLLKILEGYCSSHRSALEELSDLERDLALVSGGPQNVPEIGET